LGSRPPSEQAIQLLLAVDVLERLIWVGYGPDVADAVNALESSQVTATTYFELRPVTLPPPGRQQRTAEEVSEVRTLGALAAQEMKFIESVASDPDVLFRAVFRNLYGFARGNLRSDRGGLRTASLRGHEYQIAGE
jgi:hypothetical protein